MYVCVCRQITDQQIRDMCRDGSTSLAEMRKQLGLASECGRCCKHARELLAEIDAPAMFVDAHPA